MQQQEQQRQYETLVSEALQRVSGGDGNDELEEKAPTRSQLVDISMDDDAGDNDDTQVHDECARFSGETDSLQYVRAAWTPAAPTMVLLPGKQRTSPRVSERSAAPVSLPLRATLMPHDEQIDVDVFNALPIELQHEILAERSTRDGSSRDASFESQSSCDDEATRADLLDGSCWICRVCTFANHPELTECEICETLRMQPDEFLFGSDELRVASLVLPPTGPDSRSRAGSKGTELYAKLSQRLGSSVMSRSLKKIRLPATPTATKLTMKEDPTAEDLLVVASARVQQLQSSASQTLRHAKQTLIARTNAGKKPSTGDTLRLPSAAAVSELRMLQRELNRKCDAGDDLYESLLERLWNAIYQDAPTLLRKQSSADSSSGASAAVADASAALGRRAFERVSDGWIDIGFQGANPDTDFRGGGVLALKCLVFAFEAFPQRMLEVVAAQQPLPGKKWYPVCVAGVNVTCMLAGVLQLGTGKFADTPAPFWMLFEEPSAFYQLFFYTFVKMDATWRRMNASYMEFGVVLKATRRVVDSMLAHGPESLAELRDAADRTFLDRFVVSITHLSLADSENGECPDPYNVLEDEADVALVPSRSLLSLRLTAVVPLS